MSPDLIFSWPGEGSENGKSFHSWPPEAFVKMSNSVYSLFSK